jgi:hypothetical protein
LKEKAKIKKRNGVLLGNQSLQSLVIEHQVHEILEVSRRPGDANPYTKDMGLWESPNLPPNPLRVERIL